MPQIPSPVPGGPVHRAALKSLVLYERKRPLRHAVACHLFRIQPRRISVNRQLPGAAVRVGTAVSLSLLGFGLIHVTTNAQDRLKTMPGYAQYQRLSAQLNGAVRSGAISGTWTTDGSAVEYTFEGKRYRFDVTTHATTPVPATMEAAAGRGGRGGGRGGTGIERGRQAASADAPERFAEGVLSRSQLVDQRPERSQ